MLVETMHIWNGSATLELIAFWLVFKQCGKRNSAVDTVVTPESRTKHLTVLYLLFYLTLSKLKIETLLFI